jgi:hypothetical protein
MELKYVEELEKNGLQVKDLPEDARTGIKEINKALSFIKMGEAKGKKTSPDAIKKIKAMDKWVLYEIYDFVEDTDKNEDEIPYESYDIQEDLETQKNNQENNVQSIPARGDGNKINSELEQLLKANRTELTINEIKSYAPNTYDAIFDVYVKGEQNGVQTKSYSLIEFEEQKYKLTKI